LHDIHGWPHLRTHLEWTQEYEHNWLQGGHCSLQGDLQL